MARLLSHLLTADTPTPGGRRAVAVLADESLAAGQPGNTYYFTMWNHAGTHVDAPAHMLPGGAPIAALQPSDLVFRRPLVLDVPKGDDELIVAQELRPHEEALAACDLLLLRTGFGRYRSVDPARYRQHNPGLSAGAAEYLAGMQSDGPRAVGIDSISLAAGCHVREGIQAHLALFGAARPGTVLIIEDLNLAGDLDGLRRVILAPLFVEGLDSSPCTVIAEFAEEG